jgi:hypothetical protein
LKNNFPNQQDFFISFIILHFRSESHPPGNGWFNPGIDGLPTATSPVGDLINVDKIGMFSKPKIPGILF